MSVFDEIPLFNFDIELVKRERMEYLGLRELKSPEKCSFIELIKSIKLFDWLGYED